VTAAFARPQEEEFQDKWRIMKQGKNKPLEADEIDFLDAVAEQEVVTERRKREEEAQELESFQVPPCIDVGVLHDARRLTNAMLLCVRPFIKLMREHIVVKKAVERPPPATKAAAAVRCVRAHARCTRECKHGVSSAACSSRRVQAARLLDRGRQPPPFRRRLSFGCALQRVCHVRGG
jgi:hypothetical protein